MHVAYKPHLTLQLFTLRADEGVFIVEYPLLHAVSLLANGDFLDLCLGILFLILRYPYFVSTRE